MIPETFYHIYNRGNNQQNIFLKRENYLFFLNKVRKHLLPHLDIVAYCLMPNHFHLLAYSKANISGEKFSNDLKIMLRSYTRAINVQEGWSGSLFQQNTKKKPLEESTHGMTRSHAMSITPSAADDHPFICFHYLPRRQAGIHQNPMKAGLVKQMDECEMSSFQYYAGMRNGSLCNKQIAHEFLELPASREQFIEQSYSVTP